MRAQYDLLVKETGGQEYKARHILVPTLAEARSITAKLKAGARFEDLARLSKDLGNADNGGELGWAQASTYVPQFAAALTQLGKGQTTPAPVKTSFGYHVIRLDDVREAKVQTFEESRTSLTEAMTSNTLWQQAQFERMMAELLAGAKVE